MKEFGMYIQRLIFSDKMENLLSIGVRLLLTVVIGLIIIRIIMKITRKFLDRSNADPSVYAFVKNSVKITCLVVLVTMCMGILGIPMSTVVAVLGAAGAAIALALRDSLANIAGGMMIIITRPFSKDDLIDVGTVSGKVENIDLLLTTLKTYDNKTITIPNGLINTSILVNHSKESKRRVDCTFNIGYGNDIGRVKELLAEVCGMCPQIMSEPKPIIGVANHGESSVVMDVKAWCDTEDYWDVKYFLEEKVKLTFDENGIDIPYPQVDVNIKKSDGKNSTKMV